MLVSLVATALIQSEKNIATSAQLQRFQAP